MKACRVIAALLDAGYQNYNCHIIVWDFTLVKEGNVCELDWQLLVIVQEEIKEIQSQEGCNTRVQFDHFKLQGLSTLNMAI